MVTVEADVVHVGSRLVAGRIDCPTSGEGALGGWGCRPADRRSPLSRQELREGVPAHHLPPYLSQIPAQNYRAPTASAEPPRHVRRLHFCRSSRAVSPRRTHRPPALVHRRRSAPACQLDNQGEEVSSVSNGCNPIGDSPWLMARRRPSATWCVDQPSHHTGRARFLSVRCSRRFATVAASP